MFCDIEPWEHRALSSNSKVGPWYLLSKKQLDVRVIKEVCGQTLFAMFLSQVMSKYCVVGSQQLTSTENLDLP